MPRRPVVSLALLNDKPLNIDASCAHVLYFYCKYPGFSVEEQNYLLTCARERSKIWVR